MLSSGLGIASASTIGAVSRRTPENNSLQRVRQWGKLRASAVNSASPPSPELEPITASRWQGSGPDVPRAVRRLFGWSQLAAGARHARLIAGRPLVCIQVRTGSGARAVVHKKGLLQPSPPSLAAFSGAQRRCTRMSDRAADRALLLPHALPTATASRPPDCRFRSCEAGPCSRSFAA